MLGYQTDRNHIQDILTFVRYTDSKDIWVQVGTPGYRWVRLGAFVDNDLYYEVMNYATLVET